MSHETAILSLSECADDWSVVIPVKGPSPLTAHVHTFHMTNRISQRDLAKLAGVSPMTVSLALRDHPSISAERREHIRQLAKKHGYQPDPALAALYAYRSDSHRRAQASSTSAPGLHTTADG